MKSLVTKIRKNFKKSQKIENFQKVYFSPKTLKNTIFQVKTRFWGNLSTFWGSQILTKNDHFWKPQIFTIFQFPPQKKYFRAKMSYNIDSLTSICARPHQSNSTFEIFFLAYRTPQFGDFLKKGVKNRLFGQYSKTVAARALLMALSCFLAKIRPYSEFWEKTKKYFLEKFLHREAGYKGRQTPIGDFI